LSYKNKGVTAEASMLDVQDYREQFLIQGAVNLGRPCHSMLWVYVYVVQKAFRQTHGKKLLGLLNTGKSCLLAQKAPEMQIMRNQGQVH